MYPKSAFADLNDAIGAPKKSSCMRKHPILVGLTVLICTALCVVIGYTLLTPSPSPGHAPLGTDAATGVNNGWTGPTMNGNNVTLKELMVACDPTGRDQIKEWHFHVYYQTEREYELVKVFQEKVIQAVRNHDFVAVARGITSDDLPGLERVQDQEIRKLNDAVGPHPVSQLVMWVPFEYASDVLSFTQINCPPLSVLCHPLTEMQKLDHSDRALWLGKPIELLPGFFDGDREIVDLPFENKELGLGYHPDPESPFAPANWKRAA